MNGICSPDDELYLRFPHGFRDTPDLLLTGSRLLDLLGNGTRTGRLSVSPAGGPEDVSGSDPEAGSGSDISIARRSLDLVIRSVPGDHGTVLLDLGSWDFREVSYGGNLCLTMLGQQDPGVTVSLRCTMDPGAGQDKGTGSPSGKEPEPVSVPLNVNRIICPESPPDRIRLALAVAGIGTCLVRCVSFRPYDFTANHLFPVLLPRSDDGSGEPEIIVGRMRVNNLPGAARGVVIFCPSRATGKVFPAYNRITYGRELGEFCQIILSDPLCFAPSTERSGGSFFFGPGGHMMLEDCAREISRLIGRRHGPVAVLGSSMGGTAALILASLLQADCCIAEIFMADILSSGYARTYFEDSGLNVAASPYRRVSGILNRMERSRCCLELLFYTCDPYLPVFWEDYLRMDPVILRRLNINVLVDNDLNRSLNSHQSRPRETEIGLIKAFYETGGCPLT